MKISTLLAFFITSPCLLFAQIFYNNGATIWTGPTSVIQINGGLENNSSTSNGDLEHNGDMRVTLNSTFPSKGNVTLNNNSVMHGNGTYHVEQDWVNNATFTANNSTVELYGSNQEYITGTNVTTFHNLTATGTGSGNNRKKTQTLDAIVNATGTLDINDRELETQTNTLFVMNPSVAAVDNDSTSGSEGFVSSTAPGYLHRETNTASSYVFPVGSSSNNLTRYRPVRVQPAAPTSTYYNVRFINYDPNTDGFLRTSNDGIMCQTIDTFYHAIDPNTSNVVPANISIYYKSATDGGNWNGTAHWKTSNIMWNDMAVINQSTSNGFDVDTRNNWLFATAGFPYLLTRLRPAPPAIICQNLCANTQGTFTASGGSGIYGWSAGGGTITSGQGTSTINVNWGSNSGWVYVMDTSNALCKSNPDSCFVTAYPAPLANFDTVAVGAFSTTWDFLDSSMGGTTWSWNFGDGNSATTQNPSHHYLAAGTYTVTEIVTSAFGCVDTITKVITVEEGVIVPNVFSPDGDGTNDVWYIPNSGVKNFHVVIYDRWGAKVWETTADEIRWDGRSLAGQLLSNGTYYYALDFVFIRAAGEETKNLTGYVTLLTNKQ
ncbi:MAG: gliding motility-associated C-terminal domain-containing protein [Bacteroidetes bacterium]|nr:gliding motility-associated C-terminal domain-containing protein [Bacteroidota bacterium]